MDLYLAFEMGGQSCDVGHLFEGFVAAVVVVC